MPEQQHRRLKRDDCRRYAAEGVRADAAGKTQEQIVDYMVARYGNFVSYEPPLTAGTVLLWLGPGLFVLAGAGVIIARTRRRDIPDAALSVEERQRLAALLQEGKER